MKRTFSILILLTVVSITSASENSKAKNVILMISDGLGFNGWEASRNYDGSLPYDNAGFDFYGCTSYSLGTKGDTTPGSYDSSLYWNDFDYQLSNFTDSAAAASALNTGTKVYNDSINLDASGNPLTTIAEYSANAGKATGAVSSVLFFHATPGAVDAHSNSRGNFSEITNEMLYDSDLDVIMSATHNNSQSENYLGGADTMADFLDGEINGFKYISDINDFKALANGSMTADKVFGLADAHASLGNAYWPETNDEKIVPTLDTMTKGALNVLSQDEDGFYLMVESGAVDWVNHANNLDTMLIEMADFNNTVSSVMTWIDSNGGWEENLLIVTADHETGAIWGSDGYTHVDNPGKGIIPTFASTVAGRENIGTASAENADVVYNYGTHTNSLVPLWTKGAGSDMFAALVDGVDTQANDFWSEDYGWDWNGSYIDNTDVFTVMHNASIPEPCTVSLLALGGIISLRRRF